MSLTDHAEREMRAVGLFDEDADYGGMLADAVMELIKVFAEQDHTGCSAGMAINLFTRLARFKPLSPLTDSTEEWREIGTGVWQNIRQSSCFSNDGGKTFHDIDSKRSRWRKIFRIGFRGFKVNKTKRGAKP